MSSPWYVGHFDPHTLPPSPIDLLTNTIQQISVVLILPETKGISLERMDKLFGEVDAVAAGEEQTSAEKVEAITYSVEHEKDSEEKAHATMHERQENKEVQG